MKKDNSAQVLSAKIMNMITAGLMCICGLVILFLDPSSLLGRSLLCVLFALTAGGKFLGYFSNDLYRLAFQFDFAWGVYCAILALAMIFIPTQTAETLPLLLVVYVILDSLLKMQITFDAYRFGMKSWVAILVTSLALLLIGAFAILNLYCSWVAPSLSVGLALLFDGAQNIWLTAGLVRIRTKKKNQTDLYGF